MEQNKIELIEIGSRWEDTNGTNRYDLVDTAKIVKRGIYREIIITDKTFCSVEYKDDGGFKSWIHVDDFFWTNKKTGKTRMTKI